MLYPITVPPPISTVATPSTGQDVDIKSEVTLVCVKEMLFAMERKITYTSDTETSYRRTKLCMECSKRDGVGGGEPRQNKELDAYQNWQEASPTVNEGIVSRFIIITFLYKLCRVRYAVYPS